MKQLIVNADDFGYTRGVNHAIVMGHRDGIITSTSLMANGAAFDDAVEQTKCAPGLDVGCHLNLVEGQPVSEPGKIPHLAGTDGKFHRLRGFGLRLAAGAIPAAEIERECSAQIEKLIERGIEPSHLDTHQHVHIHPRVAAVVARVARRYSIGWVRRPFENYIGPKTGGSETGESPARKFLGWSLSLLVPGFERRMAAEGIRMPDFFTGFALTGRWTPQAMEATVSSLPQGITELMCHPGLCDAELEASPTNLKRQREAEHAIVSDPSWRAKIGERGIELRGFRSVLASSPRQAEERILRTAPSTGE